ncbi:SDR family oxidoreductase [Pedobacter sp. SYSU D00535]|uniref:SDR family oxidoreductase n=1 Tax=Pedobacter sp. SYSU D00535 TaxID=2810308 RepID=UPI001A974A90|nr:SDR family NAD(P)-dependent oxidoreductase [Pedobacter sp. SYSU D00535]
MKLTGNTVLITGGSSGYGLELAKQLTAQNNRVLICGRDSGKLAAAKELIPALSVFQCDVSIPEDCHKLQHWISLEHPTLNILVNNAAVVHYSEFLTDEETIEKAKAEFETNLLAPIRLTKLLLPILLQNQTANLINITTGLVYIPRTRYTYYNASKAALHSFTQVLRAQLAGQAIQVREIMLPAVDTPWHKGNPPKIAISAAEAVLFSLQALETDREEMRIGKVKLLYVLSRLFPKLAFNKLNSLD